MNYKSTTPFLTGPSRLLAGSDFSAIAFGGAVLTDETTTYQNLARDTRDFFRVRN